LVVAMVGVVVRVQLGAAWYMVGGRESLGFMQMQLGATSCCAAWRV
jgi:hypothetical protein